MVGMWSFVGGDGGRVCLPHSHMRVKAISQSSVRILELLENYSKDEEGDDDDHLHHLPLSTTLWGQRYLHHHLHS